MSVGVRKLRDELTGWGRLVQHRIALLEQAPYYEDRGIENEHGRLRSLDTRGLLALRIQEYGAEEV
jgi:hypothetical protein